MKARLLLCLASLLLPLQAHAQTDQPPQPKQRVRTVTVPISIFTKKELKERRPEEFVQVDTINVKEDNEPQQIISIRSVSDTPLSIAIAIQEDLASGFNNQLNDIRDFIRTLPPGTRVMVAYLRAGSPQVTQKWTADLAAAAKSLRVISSSTASASSPYDGVESLLSKFDALPGGRRAVLLFSDGLDTGSGLSLASITQSFELEQAIIKAQKRSVAVYSFYWPSDLTRNGNSVFGTAAQGALQKLADETGGRAFGGGTSEPPSFGPYFGDLSMTLSRQFALSYISTHMNKGYHPISITSTNPDVKIEHPAGYFYR